MSADVTATLLGATQLETTLHAVNRPGRNRTCNPRFWSPLLATPAVQRLLILNDLALAQQRRRCWTTPALALILALFNAAEVVAQRRAPRQVAPLARCAGHEENGSSGE